MKKPGRVLWFAALLAVALFAVSEASSNFAILRRVASLLNFNTEDTIARVFHDRITRSQLERAVRERLWHEGKSIESLTPEIRKTIRSATLDELIDQALLRIKAGKKSVPPAEIDDRFQRFLARFESKDAMVTAMKSQGIANERELHDRLAAGIQQEKYLESVIGPLAKISDDEARRWFDENSANLANPERIEARHIFLPTLDHPPEEAKAKLDAALDALTANKKDFATLARELSEDPATKNGGGALGWMSRDRLPVDFSAPVFSLNLNEPALVRTRLGWHLVEVTARKSAETPDFDKAKPEVIAALETVKRREAIQQTREALRRAAAEDIEVFHDRMAE